MAVLQAPSAEGVSLVPWTGPVQKLRIDAAATTNDTLVKTGNAVLVGYTIFNKNGSTRFLKFYDKATKPVVGTDVPDWTLTIPTATLVQHYFPHGIPYFLGLGIGMSTGIADTDTGALTAQDFEGVLLFA